MIKFVCSDETNMMGFVLQGYFMYINMQVEILMDALYQSNITA